MSTIFGPVHSRRFGVSLGIDLSSRVKQCNFDCLYCELAPAPAMIHQHTITPVEAVIADLKEALAKHPSIDVITITANGEPTMYPYLNTLIEQIDTIKGNIQTLILSNSACLNDEKVFNSLLNLDQVKLSLDAATPETFKKIDRPAEGIEIGEIIASITRFSHVFKGKLFLEILFVKGINDSLSEIEALNSALLGIHCERIDIGTIDRPPAYAVQGLRFEELYALSHHFDPTLPIHIVSRTHAQATPSSYSDSDILSTLDKRPLTRDDIDALFDSESKERFQILLNQGKILQIERSNVIFFTPSENINRKRSK
ncbi:MAG: radical SAM protein [Sulfuricurvum sp.]|uniref:radical SAM protein n=1 Tax=Sulfuricurvum sp. TaxID=2025608 RepID=UPI00260F2103|nr:radical SAM protein [Sulfuricurvum sp.]MDD2370235.1 radical SAM protein [Sulfuricurvum sp.]MDD2949990.1 radical SAM protein [Sulfuricurvum sp.]MDD5117460.1 radical SAM protein [Sulfuricurvum sp.]